MQHIEDGLKSVMRRQSDLEESHRDRERFLFGWHDADGMHKGILQTLDDGMSAMNREVSQIREQVSGFFAGARVLGIRFAVGVIAVTTTVVCATAWFAAHNAAAIFHAFAAFDAASK